MDSAFGCFPDREHAGRLLAARLTAMDLQLPVVYALPRGGVPVAVVIARALHAPLDLIMVRKIGAPFAPELALAAVADGEGAETVVNQEVLRLSGASEAFLERARKRELQEIERRRSLYLGNRPPITAAGHTAVIVDDGLATGATAKAALAAVKRRGAARTVLAIPVAPIQTLEDLRGHADAIVCLHPAGDFRGVGAFYDDFHQLTDEETVGLLRLVWAEGNRPGAEKGSEVTRSQVVIPPLPLAGDLMVPPSPRGVILFAHGSGSSRLSPRNRAVAEALNAHGFATLLLDLLTEPEAQNRRNVFDIPLLAERLLQAAAWLNGQPTLGNLPLSLFGASTGAAAALTAAAKLGARVGAVVSRGGRPDLAGASLRQVTAPTLLIVGDRDHHVLELNRQALALLTGEKRLETVRGAGHLFEEPGALEAVTAMAAAWFEHHLPSTPGEAALIS
jgi:putative phosphoribosyl transferase